MMDDLNQLLEQEKQKSDSLLLNILPKNIAQELKLYNKAPTYSFPSVSVLFVDFVGFSETVEKVDAQTLVDELHNYFANFDDVIKKYNLEKIKTIGDAYMCAGGLHQEAGEEDAQSTVYAALELAEFMEAYREERLSLDMFYFDCRIGIHTGPVIAGVVGKSKFAFDIWGQTVNIAKETESASLPGKVTISESTYELVKEKFRCIPRGEVIIKHNRGVQMYFVEGKI
jgi:adenylate cyclase